MNKSCMRVSGLLLGCASLSFNAFASDVSAYIVNGSSADIANYPSFASLFYDNGSSYGNYCGATVINSQYILTAAHCIYDDFDGMLNFYVAPGLEDESDYLNGGVDKARVEKYYYPTDYSDSDSDLYANDIAILKLETALNVGNFYALLNTTTNYTGSTLEYTGNSTTIGHGLIEGNVDGGNLLLETTLTQENNATCDSRMSNKQICFTSAVGGSGYKNSTCNGDSGGPLFWGGQQIGITSFGPKTCGDSSAPYSSAFTEVYDYQSWISQVINGQEDPKYYVVTTNGIRSLIRNEDSSVVDTDGVTTDTGGDSGGGSIGWFALLMMPLLTLVRCRKKSVLTS
ncbi:trypsin-like serine protease [Vibrio lamellibrachiae]|uniref:S1 family peptidase n=1 Tax=Vibrio lamellibrachiae TaxID=2910253 RepID=UPI003D10F002